MPIDVLLPLVMQGVRDPRGTARRLLSLDLPTDALWLALVLVVMLSVILTGVANLFFPPPEGAAAFFAMGPFAEVVLLAAMQAALVVGLWKVGRGFGGTGSLGDTLLLTTFLQVMLLVAQVVQIALLVVFPPVSAIFMVVVFFGAIVILLVFLDELHGFGSLFKALMLFLLVSVGIGLAMMTVLALSGQTVSGAV